MTFLLDTSIISELLSEKPNPVVIHWLDAQPEETIYLSVVSLAEIKQSIENLTDVKKKNRLNEWLQNDLLIRFSNRISEITVSVTLKWGELSSKMHTLGRTLSAVDSLNLAIALIYDHTLVTRDLSIFESTGVRLLNPYLDKTK